MTAFSSMKLPLDTRGHVIITQVTHASVKGLDKFKKNFKKFYRQQITVTIVYKSVYSYSIPWKALHVMVTAISYTLLRSF